MPGSVIVSSARTPIGRLSGALSSLSAADLGGHAIKAALARGGVSPDQVDYVYVGQVIQAGSGQMPARQAAVKGGISLDVPSIGLNKACLSGIDAVYLADLMIQAGDADVVVAAGMESMTRAPYLLKDARVRIPHGRRRAARLDARRRSGVRPRGHPHGREHRARRRRRTVASPRDAMDDLAAKSHERGRERGEGRALHRDRADRDPPAQGRPDRRRSRRGHPARHHHRVPRRSAARLRRRRQHHRRQRVADLRRRRGRRRDVEGQGRGARDRAARRAAGVRQRRRTRHVAAPPAVGRDQAGARQARRGGRARSTSSRSTRRSPPWASPRCTTSA